MQNCFENLFMLYKTWIGSQFCRVIAKCVFFLEIPQSLNCDMVFRQFVEATKHCYWNTPLAQIMYHFLTKRASNLEPAYNCQNSLALLGWQTTNHNFPDPLSNGGRRSCWIQQELRSHRRKISGFFHIWDYQTPSGVRRSHGENAFFWECCNHLSNLPHPNLLPNPVLATSSYINISLIICRCACLILCSLS